MKGVSMMKFLVLLFIFASAALASAAAGSNNQCADPATEKAIRQGAETWKDGYNGGDAAEVAALYTEDATYLTQHFVTGIVQGRRNIQAYVQRGVDAKYHIDSIKIMSSGCSGNLAYATTRYESTNGGQKAFGVNILVLKRVGRRWLIVAHESAVPDASTAIKNLDADR
jgi:uncharacterized protein (TIGR02246 family)